MSKNTQKKKRRQKKFDEWRKQNGVTRCKGCGKKLKHVNHHLFCNKCHDIHGSWDNFSLKGTRRIDR